MKATEEHVSERYPMSKDGKFFVKNTIGVPHPYCITQKHVIWASDHCCGMLTKEAIREAEKHGAVCGICKKNKKILTIDEHEEALLIAVTVDMDENTNKELQEYLLSIKEQCEKDGYAGFAFYKEA